MKRKSKAISACFALLCVSAGLTGCGKATVDVSPGADILVSGMSPNGTAGVNISDSNAGIDISYTPNKSSGLKNGDEVTVSISSYSGTDVEEYCMSNGTPPTVKE